MKVAVAGGTGVVGRHVVAALAKSGHEPVTLARAAGIDITTGAGLDAALGGVQAVIDVSNVVTTRRRASIDFFEAGTATLLSAGARAGVQHHVVLSIVGIYDVDFGYYFGKRRQEELALVGGVPVSVLRATQFHEFPGQLLDRGRGPVAVVPRMTVQTVAASEVADALVALVAGPAVGVAPELGGPEVHQLTDLAKAVLTKRGSSRPILRLRVPGAAGKAMLGGALVPRGDGPRGTMTFDEWLSGAPNHR
ncbi:NAD-dependent epimerase/dehydratase family protein [Jatrophihabitans sp.]|uniref:SDR family oxidoreductase n=1 Tax=Jatrophihabitans sp. TaxID=1932789 RepID=UPI0030C69924|nr:NmrA family protein [Jatrophihabitans sp.]